MLERLVRVLIHPPGSIAPAWPDSCLSDSLGFIMWMGFLLRCSMQ